MPIRQHIVDFLNIWVSNKTPEIYNEDSFKFELGLYLRNQLGNGYKVHFERNIVNLFFDLATLEKALVNCKPKNKYKTTLDQLKKNIKNEFCKAEIDILIFKGQNPWQATEKYVVELKYSTREDGAKQQREGMLKDVAFINEVTTANKFSIVGNKYIKDYNAQIGELKGNQKMQLNTVNTKHCDKAYAVTLANDVFINAGKGANSNPFQGVNISYIGSQITINRGKGNNPTTHSIPRFNTAWITNNNSDFSYYIVEKP